ncbi:MAG: FtsX-like permease family protein [Planctomycetes bacterium]|nr:FtsX-like permease family protein [Planctomycetota bacterium]
MRQIFVRHWLERPGRFFLILLGLTTATAAIVTVLCASFNARNSFAQFDRLASGLPAIDITHNQGARFDPNIIADEPLPFPALATAPMLFRGSIARSETERLRCLLLGVPLADPSDTEEISATVSYWSQSNREKLGAFLGLRSSVSLGREECILSESAARSLNIAEAGEVHILFRRSIRKLVVRHIVPNEIWQSFALEPSIIVDLYTLQKWANLKDQVDRIRIFVGANDEKTMEKRREKLSASLVDDLVANVRTSSFGSASNVFRSAELGLGFATVLAGAMSIYILLNSIRMNLLERRQHFAILRCIGATPTQIFVAILIEIAAIASLASILGLALGIALGRLLQNVLLAMTPADSVAYAVPWSTLIPLAAIVPLFSIVITCVANWEQRNISPLENFQEPNQILAEGLRMRWIGLGIGLWGISLIALIAVRNEIIPFYWAIPAGLLTLIAYLMFLPIGWVPLLFAIAFLNKDGRWFSIDLARYQLTRRAERTSLSAGFLVIALCGAIGLGQALLSNISELRRWYELAFAGDIFLVSRPTQVSDSEDPIRATLLSLDPETVQWLDSIRFFDMEIEGIAVSAIVREFPEASPFPGVLRGITQAEALSELRAGKILLNAILAKRLGKRTRDRILLQYMGQVSEFEVAGTFVDFKNGGMSILTERRAMQSRWVVTGFDLLAIRCSPDKITDVTRSIQSLEAANSIQIIPGNDLRSSIDSSISSVILGITLVVISSFAIGGLGIASTMAMNVTEQTKDFSLLRLIGMSQRQVLICVMAQGLLLGIIGSVFGWIGGVTTAWIIHACSEVILGYTPRFESAWHLPGLSIAGAIFVVIIASLIPAFRAAQVDPKKSLQYEI